MTKKAKKAAKPKAADSGMTGDTLAGACGVCAIIPQKRG
jgi:hypothetical protein